VRVLAIVNQRDAGPGVFGQAVEAAGHELVEWAPAEEDSPPDAFDAAMAFGGAMNVDEEDRHPWLAAEKRLLAKLLERGTPLLGVCLGAQLVADAAGAEVRRAREPEIGWYEVERDASDDPVIGPLPERFTAFGWHSYEFALPPGAVALAHSAVCLQAFRAGARAWGIQFHAEVTPQILNAWLDGYRNDPDAVRVGLDPEALRAESEQRIDAWNQLGRGLCERFLKQAATPA
jgi:GMP synthase-like glutamine amidotransferase